MSAGAKAVKGAPLTLDAACVMIAGSEAGSKAAPPATSDGAVVCLPVFANREALLAELAIGPKD